MYSRKRKCSAISEVEKKQLRISGSSTSVKQGDEISQYDHLNAEMLDLFKRNEQDNCMYRAKHNLRDVLMRILQKIFPYGGLYIVGSSGNSFGTKSCDLDLCFMVSEQEIDQKREAPAILKMIHKSLRRVKFIRQSTFIRARVPIIKFRDEVSGVSCDMNLNNQGSIRNTHFLRYYGYLDPRVRPLVICLKVWAKFQDINDASKQTLSSYSLTLMVIHVLQTVKPPVLPVLHDLLPEIFNIKVDIKSLSLSDPLPEWKSENELSVGELLIRFLNYYANEFNFEEKMISVRRGCVLPRPLQTGKNGKDWKFLCIEEPFELTNTARSVYELSAFEHIRRVFKRSYEKITVTKQFSSIIEEPF